MNRILTILFIAIVNLFVVMSCSEDKSPLQSVSHPEEWNTAGIESFHGSKVLEVGYMSCKSCHGIDLDGGRTEVSCFKCHQTYPHPLEWNYITDENFHGKYIEKNNDGATYCKGCHGSNYAGGRSGVSCYACHPAVSLP